MTGMVSRGYAQELVKLKGLILELPNADPLPYANVVLLDIEDSSKVVGQNADINGRFELQAQPGIYLLWVSFIGFTAHFESITLQGSEVRVRPIRLKPDVQFLEEATVEAASTLFSSDFEKKVFQVDQVAVAEGGSAIDLLETLPSIQVSEDGTLSLRGSGDILVFINGRQTSLSANDAESVLQQFPASAIESVELITNPSSRYDAAGVGGIINIVLKKGQMKGLNGQVNSSIGTNHKYQTGLNLNYRTDAINYFVQYNYQYRQLWQVGETDRQNFSADAAPIFLQNLETTNINQNHSMRMGMDWDISKGGILGLFINSNWSPRGRDRVYDTRFLSAQDLQDRAFMRMLDEEQYGVNHEAGLNFTQDFKDTSKLFFVASFSQDHVRRVEFFNQFDYDQSGQRLPENQIYQEFNRPRFTQQAIVQIDYERPLSKESRVDVGAKSTLRNFGRDQWLEVAASPDAPLVLDPLVSDTFNFREDVHAAYVNYRNRFGKWGVQGGLRAEYTFTTGTPSDEHPIINNYLSWFPSAYIDLKVGKEGAIMTNYSRRISRPGVGALAPLFNVQDPFNLRVGNPFLQPAFTDNYELGYADRFHKVFSTFTLFYRKTTDNLFRVFEAGQGGSVIMTWINAAENHNSGLEWVNQIQVGNNVDATFTANAFYADVRAETPQDGLVKNTNFSWTMTLLANWRLPRIMNVQFNGSYRGPIILPQGEIAPIFYLNMGLRREILKGQGTLSLNLTDIFGTQVFRIETQTSAFSQKRYFDWETRIMTVGFTYRFKGFKARQTDHMMRGVNGEEAFD
jgi:iron complex outermembrane receptor protein